MGCKNLVVLLALLHDEEDHQSGGGQRHGCGCTHDDVVTGLGAVAGIVAVFHSEDPVDFADAVGVDIVVIVAIGVPVQLCLELHLLVLTQRAQVDLLFQAVQLIGGAFEDDLVLLVLDDQGQLGEEVFHGKYFSIAFGVGKYSGGGMRQTADAVMDDGLLDMLIVDNISRMKFFSLVGDYRAGTYIDPQTREIKPRFKNVLNYYRCKKIKIEGISMICADGELEKAESVEIEVVPLAINYIG